MEEKLSPIATAVIYEDDHVRVWNQVVAAGETIKKHEHTYDYFLVNLAGTGPIDVEFHDGTGGDFGEQMSYNPKPGRAEYIPKGHIETAHNQGEEFRAILVELKKPK